MRPSGKKANRQGRLKVVSVVRMKGRLASGFCSPTLTWAQTAADAMVKMPARRIFRNIRRWGCNVRKTGTGFPPRWCVYWTSYRIRIVPMSFSIVSRTVATGILLTAFAVAAASPPIPPPSTDVSLASKPGKETAVFAGGCFWGVQSVFQRVKGVLSTTAGYSGGSAKTATYEQVVTETTGHAESVEVIYDPSRIT